MALPSLRLVAQGLGELDFDPYEGWIIQSFDPGFPIVRESVEDAPDADGTVDSTHLSGARVCTLSLVMSPFDGDIDAMERRLKAFLNPRLRPTLYWRRNSLAEERQATVRAMPYAGPVDFGDETTAIAQWVVPSGLFESADLQTVEVAASDEGVDGITLELALPFVFPAANPSASVEVTNYGDRQAYPLIHLHGPWSGEARVQNMTTGREIVIDGENVAAGNYLAIDTRKKTVLLNGDPSNSRYNRLVFPDTQWWAIQPGTQRLRFLAETAAAPARMLVAFRSAYS